MITRFLILLLCCFSFSLNAQVKVRMHGTYNIVTAVRVGTTNKFSLYGLFNNVNASYTAINVQVGDQVLMFNQNKYIRLTIDSIVLVNSNLLSLRVVDSTSSLITINPGMSILFRPTVQRKLPLVAEGAPLGANYAALNDALIRIDSVSSSSQNYNGNRVITGSLLTGQNMGTTGTIQNFLDAVFFPTQVPIATLTATYLGLTSTTTQIERAGGGPKVSVTLNWGAGRQLATTPLQSTVVAGQTVSANPTTNQTITGSVSFGLNRNVDTTLTNLVTTTDGKTASANAIIQWLPKFYLGPCNGVPTSSDIVATGGGLTSTKNRTSVSIGLDNSTFRNVFYAYPTSFGLLNSIIISGIESINAFTRYTVSVTNASFFTQDYYVYVSNNTFNNTIIAFNSIN